MFCRQNGGLGAGHRRHDVVQLLPEGGDGSEEPSNAGLQNYIRVG